MKFLSLLALVAFASAAPTSEPGNDLVERFSGGCGVKQASFYGDAQVAAAANQACTLFRSGKVVGSNKYPHKFNNGEKFKFHGVAGPYQEFPIIKTGAIYNGGSPGPDRVVINSACTVAGLITHNGASGNKFVACSGTN
ncbi:hypothetical protein M441DRAFT_175802 [Trichoderma asperellum CBS 433.97]|uniref:ribonuclease T1 n=1 Tax=Trichoderma asperellum (strain ATCC 204424 / CBS 433.97 / NBRC 101777) TaxID=1042311 RepID=A0A2T3YXH5_TRIA4|nr:hypothetical protein M441DRAFT_175802 [Trichoderma asperellum CBS 433.97]PTB37259.1 hypothetical protein M441DRAFT_175802 [Trichoderma asperellum CBS 433.97]